MYDAILNVPGRYVLVNVEFLLPVRKVMIYPGERSLEQGASEEEKPEQKRGTLYQPVAGDE